MSDTTIRTLADFGSLRSAPSLQPDQRLALTRELVEAMTALTARTFEG